MIQNLNVLDDRNLTEAAIVTVAADGDAKSIRVAFESPYEGTEIGVIEYSNQRISVIAKANEIENVAVGDTVEINEVVYNIIAVEADGEGTITMRLSKN